MANSGPNTNNSQFHMTFIPCDWLDEKHVVFGRIIDGFGVLDVIESMGSQTGKTRTKIVIVDCGGIDL